MIKNHKKIYKLRIQKQQKFAAYWQLLNIKIIKLKIKKKKKCGFTLNKLFNIYGD